MEYEGFQRYVSAQFSSAVKSCPTLCNPMDSSMPGFPVHHQLLESIQTHVHWVSDAINHLILCCPLLLLPSIFRSIRVFSSESVLLIRWPNSILTLWNSVVSSGQSVWAWRIHNASVSDESGNSKVISPDENFTWLYNAESWPSLHPKQTTFYWSIVHLQCCISFRYTAKWFTYGYILFQILFHYSLLQDIECSSLCHSRSYCLSICV